VEDVMRFGRCVAKQATTATRLQGGGDLPLKKADVLSSYTRVEGDVYGTFRGVEVSVLGDAFDCRPDPESTFWLKMRNQSGKIGWSSEGDKFDGPSQSD
jgi:hypothetical protein